MNDFIPDTATRMPRDADVPAPAVPDRDVPDDEISVVGGSESAGAVPRAPFSHLSRRRVRGVLNCLTESAFFYREDDPDLFDYLRRHRAEFERFFGDYFSWDLHVDRKVARLYRREQYNKALTPKQRSLFDLTRRDECILFMLLLEFYEMQLAAQNVHFEHDDDLNFVLADFVEHAVARYRKELGEGAPGDRELLNHIYGLFRELEKHRFLRLVERADIESAEEAIGGQTEHLLYAFLPGIRCYDPTRLSSAVFETSYGTAAEEDPSA
jgi:hypothetical protein